MEREGGGAWRRRISSPVGVGALRDARVGAAEEEEGVGWAGRSRGEARTGASREGVRWRDVEEREAGGGAV